MRERILNVLKQIASEPQLEARWLNTVSLMEFIGARKISRTVADRHPSTAVLQHLSDETRHALAFKKLAHEVGGREPEGYLCTDAAKTYFQTLDRALSAWAAERRGSEDTFLNYLLTTTLIEQRAMVIYPLYKAATRSEVVRAELKAVVIEEQSHRAEIEDRCRQLLERAGVASLDEPEALEAKLFERFLTALEAEVGSVVALAAQSEVSADRLASARS